MQRRMSSFREYKFFRSFSAKIENWPMRKAEAIWRKMRERKIAGECLCVFVWSQQSYPFLPARDKATKPFGFSRLFVELD